MRYAMVLPLLALLAGCDGNSPADPTALNSQDLAVARQKPGALAGSWRGTYPPTGTSIIYTFTATGAQEVNWRTGNLAWIYTATYSLNGAAPEEFTADFEAPVAYWGATSLGTLDPGGKRMTVQSADVPPFEVRKTK